MDTAEVDQPSFCRRFLKGVALLAVGAAAHLWVVPGPPRAPRTADTVMPAPAVVQQRAAEMDRAVGTSGVPAPMPMLDASSEAAAADADDLVTLRTAAVVPPPSVQLRPAAISTSSAPSSRPPRNAGALASRDAPGLERQAGQQEDEALGLRSAALAPEAAPRTAHSPTREYAMALEASSPERSDGALGRRPGGIVMTAGRMDLVADLPAHARAVPPPAPSTEVRPEGVAQNQEEALVRRLLQQYRAAYEQLDAGAAKVVWPSVDERALGSAFRQLAGQRLTFESCGISVSGAAANARCRGKAEYLPKVGSREAYVASGEWVFDLAKRDSSWRIVSAKVQ